MWLRGAIAQDGPDLFLASLDMAAGIKCNSFIAFQSHDSHSIIKNVVLLPALLLTILIECALHCSMVILEVYSIPVQTTCCGLNKILITIAVKRVE